MSRSIPRAWSRYSLEAARLLGRLVRAARIERKLSAQVVADRAGVSRGLVQRIEKGDMNCAIGAVFEVATIVGVRLFDLDESTLARQLRATDDRLSLLPKSVREKKRVVKDDF